MTDTINGGTIIARGAMPPAGFGFRDGEIILVSKPSHATSMNYVTARLYGNDKSWDGGNYFDDPHDALKDFSFRLLRSWGISEKT